jgi:hypothetical protein
MVVTGTRAVMGSDQNESERMLLDQDPTGAERKQEPTPQISVLWYTLRGRPWRTLALVAPGNASRAWRLALEFRAAEAGSRHNLHVVNALNASVGRVAAVAHALSAKKLESAPGRPRFIVAVDSPLENPVAIGLLSACDAVVLLLERRRTRIPDAQRIFELVGPERFIGAVLGPG